MTNQGGYLKIGIGDWLKLLGFAIALIGAAWGFTSNTQIEIRELRGTVQVLDQAVRFQNQTLTQLVSDHEQRIRELERGK